MRSAAWVAAGLLAGISAALLSGGDQSPVRGRVRELFGSGRPTARTVVAPVAARLSSRVAAGLAGTAVALLVGGPVGTILGLAAGITVDRLVRRLPATAQRRRAQAMVSDLPLALNLLAACLEAGSPLGPAVEAVGTALGGPLGSELVAVAVSLRLGSSPEHAWSRLAAEPLVRPVARAVVRVSDSGAALAPLVFRLADEQRDRTGLAAEGAARRAGVLVVAPLGLCFLPAFLLLGVVPVVIGLASVVLG